MALVVLVSAKGAPGVTTLTVALAALTPGAVAADLDPDGGDLGLRYRRPDGAPLDAELGLLSLVAGLRRDLPGHRWLPPTDADAGPEGPTRLEDHLQVTGGGLDLLLGVNGPEQASGLGPLWSPLARALSEAGRTVFADCGRVGPAAPTMPVLHQADAVIVVARPELEELAHLRERLRFLNSAVPGRFAGRAQIGVVLVAPERDRAVAGRTEQLLHSSGVGVPVLGTMALDQRGAEALRGMNRSKLARSTLIRSVRSLLPSVSLLAGSIPELSEVPTRPVGQATITPPPASTWPGAQGPVPEDSLFAEAKGKVAGPPSIPPSAPDSSSPTAVSGSVAVATDLHQASPVPPAASPYQSPYQSPAPSGSPAVPAPEPVIDPAARSSRRRRMAEALDTETTGEQTLPLRRQNSFFGDAPPVDEDPNLLPLTVAPGVYTAKTGEPTHRAAEFGGLEPDGRETGGLGTGRFEFGPVRGGAVQGGAVEVDASEVGSTEVGSAEIGAAEVGAAEEAEATGTTGTVRGFAGLTTPPEPLPHNDPRADDLRHTRSRRAAFGRDPGSLYTSERRRARRHVLPTDENEPGYGHRVDEGTPTVGNWRQESPLAPAENRTDTAGSPSSLGGGSWGSADNLPATGISEPLVAPEAQGTSSTPATPAWGGSLSDASTTPVAPATPSASDAFATSDTDASNRATSQWLSSGSTTPDASVAPPAPDLWATPASSPTPGWATPGGATAGSTTSDSATSGLAAPGPTTPGSITPGAAVPDSTTPDSGPSGSAALDSGPWGSFTAGSTSPDSATPNSATSGSAAPGPITPGPATPDSTTPDSTTPGSTTPDTSVTPATSASPATPSAPAAWLTHAAPPPTSAAPAALPTSMTPTVPPTPTVQPTSSVSPTSTPHTTSAAPPAPTEGKVEEQGQPWARAGNPDKETPLEPDPRDPLGLGDLPDTNSRQEDALGWGWVQGRGYNDQTNRPTTRRESEALPRERAKWAGQERPEQSPGDSPESDETDLPPLPRRDKSLSESRGFTDHTEPPGGRRDEGTGWIAPDVPPSELTNIPTSVPTAINSFANVSPLPTDRADLLREIRDRARQGTDGTGTWAGHTRPRVEHLRSAGEAPFEDDDRDTAIVRPIRVRDPYEPPEDTGGAPEGGR